MPKADWTCDSCGEILPADHFTKVTDREVAGTSSTSRHYKGTRGGFGFGGSSSTRYRHVTRKLCPQCMAARIAMIRAARRRQRIAWLVVILAVIGLALALRNAPRLPALPNDTPTQSDATDTNASELVDSNQTADSTDAPLPVGQATPANDVSQPNAEEPVAIEPTEQRSDVPESTAGDSDKEMADAIAAATTAALGTGEPATWAAGKRHGYVVVSVARQEREAACRNVYWTLIMPNNEIQGPTATWCKRGDGDWKKRE